MKTEILISDSFDLSRGRVYIVQFPEGIVPLAGLRFVCEGIEWLINGVRWPKLGDDERVWDCMISAVSHDDKKLSKGICVIEIQNEERCVIKNQRR